MKSPTIFSARRTTRLAVAGSLATAAAVGALVVSQTGVTGAEKDPTEFTVVGDGELETKRPSLNDSRDPLSTEETSYAIHIASTDSSIPQNATNVSREPAPEFLYADISDADVDAGGRTALVVLYDYSGNKTYHQLVDLKAGKVTRSRSAARLQPPVSADEAKTAITIAINSDERLPFLKQFEESVGVPLVSPEQVSYAAGAWTYDETTARGSSCGVERCARLVVSTPSGAYLGTTDFVVNLSTGKTITLETKS